MTDSEVYLGLPDFKITQVSREGGKVTLRVIFTGRVECPDCGSEKLRNRGGYERTLRHEGFGRRLCILILKACKWQCRECGRGFRQRFPGILPWQRATEAFRAWIFQQHWDGISRSRLAAREQIGPATVERHFQHVLRRKAAELAGAACPRVLGIDEHFFSRRHGYATTFCDLEKHRVYDVVLGRSEASLEAYLRKLKGRERVRIVCMDLSPTYRSIVGKYFPNALIVTDRFHVIRLVQQQFLALWRSIDPASARNRGLVSLLRRHAKNLSAEQGARLARYFEAQPAVAALYDFRERLIGLLLEKGRNRHACRPLARQFLGHIEALRQSAFAGLQALGDTLHSWQNEIGRMWRFSRSNGITEGFHTKMVMCS